MYSAKAKQLIEDKLKVSTAPVVSKNILMEFMKNLSKWMQRFKKRMNYDTNDSNY